MGSDGTAPVLVYDACILYPFHLRNLFVQLAVDGLIQARWTDDIHEEWTRSVLAARPDLPRAQIDVARAMMAAAVPDAQVTGHQRHTAGIALPDPDDRHVVAAAIESGADGILSADRHFRPADLARHGLAIHRPGDLLPALYRADPPALLASVRTARRNLTVSAPTPAQFTSALRRVGKLGAFCDILDRHHDAL